MERKAEDTSTTKRGIPAKSMPPQKKPIFS
jgi:hypothetical protein